MKNFWKDKRNILIIGISGICFLTIIISVSYAYIAYSTRQEGINVLETDCISVTMEELTNAINLKNTHPITDEVGKNLKPFRFKLTNTCGVGVDYNVNLEVMETESRIASKNIATKVDENAKSILSNNPSAPLTYKESDYTAVEAYTIHSGSIKPYESVEHEVRIWLDESAGNDSQNGTFYSKVVIDARQNQIAVEKFVDYILSDTSKDFEVFTHEATSQTPALTDYRYTGSNPNNYVCFGSEEETCPEDNLYRIIGVIPTQSEVDGEYENRVKLIKNSYFTNTKYSWGANKTNNQWDSSPMKIALNNSYYNTLGEYQKYIVSSVWYLGAPTYSTSTSSVWELYTPERFYNLERSSTRAYAGGNLNTIANIGLMYPSDYAYSLGSNFINESVYTNANKYIENAWLYNANGEFTISPEATWYMTSRSALAWFISVEGCINVSYVYYEDDGSYLKPTFYLKERVLYKSGDGTKENPYRISINE